MRRKRDIRGERSDLRDEFAGRCCRAVRKLYEQSRSAAPSFDEAAVCDSAVRAVVQMASVLTAAARVSAGHPLAAAFWAASHALEVLSAGHDDKAEAAYDEARAAVIGACGFDLFGWRIDGLPIDEPLSSAAQALLAAGPEASLGAVFFEALHPPWIGAAYQKMLGLRPCGPVLKPDAGLRKKHGVYFTPESLVEYVVECVLEPLLESRGALREDGDCCDGRGLRILDPSMGGGDFLAAAVDSLCRGCADAERARAAANCVYGVDVDPVAVEIARFCVWSSGSFDAEAAQSICQHLVRADALAIGESETGWPGVFPEAFSASDPGFDAVIGNPPYVASKNGMKPSGSKGGQSDYYLLFLRSILERDLVAQNGMFSMVLPDPMLVRENAAQVRRALVLDWEMLSLLHISGAFADAFVANAVPVCRRGPVRSGVFSASRIDRQADRRSFLTRPRQTAAETAVRVSRSTVLAQDRAEILYLLEQEPFAGVLRRIHGADLALSNYRAPFAPLRSLNVRYVYRGEEVGKAAIAGDVGDLPILLGGQSIQPYEVVWEGRRVERSNVVKSVERYCSSKVLIQKSSDRLIAAFDAVSRKHPGYVFPQSVYAVELERHGMHPLYLLCLLNSALLNEYIWRTATAYKLFQPQLELEDIRRLPIRRVRFTTAASEREHAAAEGIRIFEDEALRTGVDFAYPGLANFAATCLEQTPERSDVVHDMLVHLGKLVVDLTRSSRSTPEPETTRRLLTVRRGIETLVGQLYSSHPAQMELPW